MLMRPMALQVGRFQILLIRVKIDIYLMLMIFYLIDEAIEFSEKLVIRGIADESFILYKQHLVAGNMETPNGAILY